MVHETAVVTELNEPWPTLQRRPPTHSRCYQARLTFTNKTAAPVTARLPMRFKVENELTPLRIDDKAGSGTAATCAGK